MERIVKALYKLSSDLHGILNGVGNDGNGMFWRFGKLVSCEYNGDEYFQKINAKSTDSNGEIIGGWIDECLERDFNNQPGMIDCRNSDVDLKLKILSNERIKINIVEFLESDASEDEVLLMLGAAINLYYVVGLYQTFGKFNLDEIVLKIKDIEAKKYAELINEYVYSRYILGVCQRANNMKLSNAQLDEDILIKMCDEKQKIDISSLYEAVDSKCRNLVPELYMLLIENDFERNAQDLLNRMILEYPEFKFAFVYKCLDKGIDFYNSQGKDIEVYKYKNKLGAELFWHILGLKDMQLDGVQFEHVNGEITTTRNALLSTFGLGIPCLEMINRNAHISQILAIVKNEEQYIPELSNKFLREDTEKDLGIRNPVCIDDDPAKYTIKLVELIETQNNEIREKNQELAKISEQQRTMMDHLAHSWGNECYPEIVKSVANQLLKDGNKTLATKLFKAYNSENNLMGEIVFLQAAISNNPRTLRNTVEESILVSGKNDAKYKIQTLIEEKLDVLVFSLLNYNGSNDKRLMCQKHLCSKHDLEFLRNEYAKRMEQRFSELSFFSWFQQEICPLKIDIDSTWESINIKDTGNGRIVLKNIFSELLTNMFFHGIADYELVLTSDNERLYIITRNKFDKASGGSKKGLKALKEVVAKLNYDSVVAEDECMVYKETNNSIFETRIVLSKELLVLEDW